MNSKDTVRLSSLRGKTYDLSITKDTQVSDLKKDLFGCISIDGGSSNIDNSTLEIMYEGETLDDDCLMHLYNNEGIFYYIMKSKPITVPQEDVKYKRHETNSKHILPMVKDYIKTPSESVNSNESYELTSFQDRFNTKEEEKIHFKKDLAEIYSTLEEYKFGIDQIQKRIEFMITQLPKDSM